MAYDYPDDYDPTAMPVPLPERMATSLYALASGWLALALIELHDRGINDAFTLQEMNDAARAYHGNWTPDPLLLSRAMAHDLLPVAGGRFRARPTRDMLRCACRGGNCPLFGEP